MPSSPKYVSLGSGQSALALDALVLEGGSPTNNVPVFDSVSGTFKAAPAGSISGGTRDVWSFPSRGTSTNAGGVVMGRIAWVPTDHPGYASKHLHLRAILSISNGGQTAALVLTSLVSGADLTIHGGGNIFSTNSTDPVIVESDLDLFTTPSNVFNPAANDILELKLQATGGATALLDYAELLLV